MVEYELSTKAYGVEEKVASKHGQTASHVYLPAEWTGKRIMVLLLEPIDAEK